MFLQRFPYSVVILKDMTVFATFLCLISLQILKKYFSLEVLDKSSSCWMGCGDLWGAFFSSIFWQFIDKL